MCFPRIVAFFSWPCARCRVQADPRGYGGRWDSRDFLRPIYTSSPPVGFNGIGVSIFRIVTFLKQTIAAFRETWGGFLMPAMGRGGAPGEQLPPRLPGSLFSWQPRAARDNLERRDAFMGENKISPKQKYAAEMLGLGAGIDEVAAEMGVKPATIRRWAKENDFLKARDEAMYDRLGSLVPVAMEVFAGILTGDNKWAALQAARELFNLDDRRREKNNTIEVIFKGMPEPGMPNRLEAGDDG